MSFFFRSSSSSSPSPSSPRVPLNFLLSFLILALAALLAISSTFQMITKFREVHGMLEEHSAGFGQIEKQFDILMAPLRRHRQRRIPASVPDGFPLPPPSVFGQADQCQCDATIADRCPAGRPGKRGEMGRDGSPGTPGLAGSPGLPGNFPPIIYDADRRCRVCPMGETGEPGRAGLSGEPARAGPVGPPGRPGKNGQKGEPGRMGEAGVGGAAGRSGKRGRPGRAGIREGKGEPGGPGQRGEPGKPGVGGAEGRRGTNGAFGRAGPPGKPGKPGRKGHPGERGIVGPVGEPGPDRFYCPCPREKIRTELLSRPMGYGPKNPTGRKRPGMGSRNRHQKDTNNK